MPSRVYQVTIIVKDVHRCKLKRYKSLKSQALCVIPAFYFNILPSFHTGFRLEKGEYSALLQS